MDAPKTRYASVEGAAVAYQVAGDGPLDVVWVPGWVSHLELIWESPWSASFFERLAGFGRLILFDKRGTGLSDRALAPSLEAQYEDIGAVMDAVGSKRAALIGYSEGAQLACLFAATHPERVSALVLVSALFRATSSPAYPEGVPPEMWQAFLTLVGQRWGDGVFAELFAPSLAGNPEWTAEMGRWQRMMATPQAAVAIARTLGEGDVIPILPSVRVPTLIVHRTDDRTVPVAGARRAAAAIPGARLAELPGEDHMPFVGDTTALLDEIEEFLTGSRPAADADRVLATVMFTDVVGSTERAVRLGDRRWRELLESHYRIVRRELVRHDGREIKTIGDGFLASFSVPGRAIRCAVAVRDATNALGVGLRAGLHTGECEAMGEDLGGIAVHIGARVAAMAADGEVLVTGTVKDLSAGSGIGFADRGTHRLKGIPEEWRLFAVEA